jgi:hypothetical protein
LSPRWEIRFPRVYWCFTISDGRAGRIFKGAENLLKVGLLDVAFGVNGDEAPTTKFAKAYCYFRGFSTKIQCRLGHPKGLIEVFQF